MVEKRCEEGEPRQRVKHGAANMVLPAQPGGERGDGKGKDQPRDP